MDATEASALSDDDFLTAFEQRRLDEFPHPLHLRMAWIYIKNLGVDQAVGRVTGEIRALARERGQGTLYHETISRAWVYVIAEAMGDAGVGFDAWLRSHPDLLDKNLLLRYYRRETLASPGARASWVAPDLRALPGAPPSQSGAPATREAPITGDAFLAVMRCLPAPVAVVACRDALDVHATTISSIVSLSLDPPTICFGVRSDSRVLAMIRSAGLFSVSFLAGHQANLADRFAAVDRPAGHSQFANVPHRAGRSGLPILTEAAAWLECDASREERLATRVLVHGVVTAAAAGTSHPLIRFSGTYM